MSSASITERINVGVIELVDASGNTVLVIDGPNRTCTVPSGTTFALASGSTASLADEILAAADLALAEGNILVGNASGAAAALSAKTDTRILVGNGTTITSVAVSGDATLANTGALTLAAGSVDSAEIAADAVDLSHLGSDTNTWLNEIRTYLADGMLAISTLTVSATAEKFKTTTTAIYTISGAAYSKAATDNLVFSTAGTINTAGAAGTAHWGAWLVQIDSAGTVTTKAVGGGTTDQDYATEALAIAALPAVTAANCPLGYITVQGLASTAWVATTSNLTVGAGAGNCTARSFYDLPAAKSLPAAL